MMNNFLMKLLTWLKMTYVRFALYAPLMRATHHPQRIQDQLLSNIIHGNKETGFGKDHHFSDIHTYADFQKTVPIGEYENLRSYIEQQEVDRKPHLNLTHPVMYAQTSGTTGKPKNIPVLQSTIDQYRRGQHIVAYAIYKAIPGAYDGKVLAITSPAVEGVMETGTQYGAMSGLIYKSMPKMMQAKYVLPKEVFEISDYDEKYYEITKLAAAEKNITMVATANPSTLVKLDQVLNLNARQLIDDIAEINRERSEELARIYADHQRLRFNDIWPHVQSVTTWTGGNCGVLIPGLKALFPSKCRFVELGYLASEFRGGITIDVINNFQIPTFHENFMEFVEQNKWENDQAEFLRLEQIEKGQHYYIFVTTQNGLYRYNINDLIEVTGRFNNTPTIQFVQKGKGVSNLTGEKLYEGQLVQAITEQVKETKTDLKFFKMLGNAQNCEYTLYIENEVWDSDVLEIKLARLNIEFRDKRKSGRLKPIKLSLLRTGTGEAYKKHCIESGQREGQFKMTYLQNTTDCSFDFTPYALKKNYETV